ncbi:MAG: hypothetical protein JST35_05015 [Armatimonadetes bacterium]|nr:hypothetical protein [Armatimonadota bacterium]
MQSLVPVQAKISPVPEAGSRGYNRLSQVLATDENVQFGSFAPLPSNVSAAEAALLFACGMEQFVAIVGPSGWGKSHLVRAARTRLSLEAGPTPTLTSALDFIAAPGRFDLTAPLLLDNVQDAMKLTRSRLRLRLALERRVRGGRPTFLAFTSPMGATWLKSHLPSASDWTLATIREPKNDERFILVNHLARAYSMEIGSGLAGMIATTISGNGRTLRGVLQRLSMYGSGWQGSTATIRALGILNSFFADSPTWDLVQMAIDAETSRDLTTYTLLRVAQLPEDLVAQRLGSNPGAIYRTTQSVARRLATSPDAQRQLDLYLDRLNDSMLSQQTRILIGDGRPRN